MTIYEMTVCHEPEILGFLASKPNRSVIPRDLHRYFQERKRENPDKYTQLKFGESGWSDELECVINNSTRGGLVNQRAGYVEITNLGKKLLTERKLSS